jgi:hypothetical protein
LPKINAFFFDLRGTIRRNRSFHNLFVANEERPGEQQRYVIKHVTTLLHRYLAAKTLFEIESAII